MNICITFELSELQDVPERNWKIELCCIEKEMKRETSLYTIALILIACGILHIQSSHIHEQFLYV